MTRPAGLAITLRVLAGTANEAAVDVLLPALDHPQESIQEAALRALLERRSTAGDRAIVRQYARLRQRWLPLLEMHRASLAGALRDALAADKELAAVALQAIAELRQYELTPVLLAAIEAPGGLQPLRPEQTLLQLAESLHLELTRPRDYSQRRDPHAVRRKMVEWLQEAVARFATHRSLEIVVAFLTTATRDNSLLKTILGDRRHACHKVVIEQLLTSDRPGVVELLLSFLDEPQPTATALALMSRRTDRPFVDRLLHKIGREPASLIALNLRRVEDVPWAKVEFGLLDQLDDARQHSAVKLLVCTGMPREDVFRSLRHILRYGSAGGRRAAIAGLQDDASPDADALVRDAIEDPDPLVRAAALRQLRPRNLAGAVPLLIEAVDAHDVEVREAARASLGEFRFKRFLTHYDQMPDDVRRTTGRLVRKIDPDCIELLKAELLCNARPRRLRAVDAAQDFVATREVEDELLQLLSDEDHMLRTKAAVALQHNVSREVREALQKAQLDSSPQVREAAATSLRLIEAAAPTPPVAPIKPWRAALPAAPDSPPAPLDPSSGASWPGLGSLPVNAP